MNASTDFVVAFLGALFAILVALLIVYTYVMLRLVPKLTRGFRDFIDKHANMDPALRQFGVAPAAFASAPAAPSVRVVYTCDDHGRCVGCPKVLAQFEAIIRHQGEDTFDEVERGCYAQLKEQFTSDAGIEGESEIERQRRIAARVVEALVREGFSTTQARGVVWAIGKGARKTYADWLAAALSGCAAVEKIEEKV